MTLLVSTFVVFVSRLLSLRDVTRQRFKGFSDSMHKLNHLVRDDTYSMQKKYRNGEFTSSGLGDHLEGTLRQVLDFLVTVLESSTGKNVCANIKVFDPEDHDFLLTPARSTNTPTDRLHRRAKRPISAYYGLSAIMSDGLSYFYSPDLRSHRVGDQFLSSIEGIDLSGPYVASISVPIRIEQSLTPNPPHGESRGYKTIRTNNSYNIFGFLCVDSQSTSAFRLYEEESYVSLLKAFSNTMYTLLDKYYHLSRQLKKPNDGGKDES